MGHGVQRVLDRSVRRTGRGQHPDVAALRRHRTAHPSVPGLDVLELPAATVASVVRRGAVQSMDEAHQVIARWAESNGHAANVEQGRWRESYLETNDADYSDWLIEVQLELDGR